MIDIFRNPAYQLFFLIKKSCVMRWSQTVLSHFASYSSHTNSQALHLVFNVRTNCVRGRAVFCLLLTLKCVLSWSTQRQLMAWSWMEITTFHLTECPLTESCVSIQNKQIILRRTGTCPHLHVSFCMYFLCVCVCVCVCKQALKMNLHTKQILIFHCRSITTALLCFAWAVVTSLTVSASRPHQSLWKDLHVTVWQ